MQTKSVIQKTATLKSVYYKTKEGTLMDNNGDLTLLIGHDGFCGVTSLEAGLKMIGWDLSLKTNHEVISWIA